MPRNFQSVGLIGKYEDPGTGDSLRNLAQHLRDRGLRVVLDQATAERIGDLGVESASREAIGENCDLAVVVGGDGTLLNAARTLSNFDIPVVGVNMGRLGFLVDVSPANMMPCLDAILEGRYREEDRVLLRAQVFRDDALIMESDALNDVVIHKWQVARMIEFETWIDGAFVHTHRSDGVIVSTPTGSTAYALSGGGPILHPSLPAVVLVPICPHTLTNRPIVVGADSRIEISITHSADGEGQITCDGQVNARVAVGDRICISAKARKLRLLHPADYDYFRILRTKLRWSEHP